MFRRFAGRGVASLVLALVVGATGLLSPDFHDGSITNDAQNARADDEVRGVITFDTSENPLSNATTQVLQGKHVGSRCSFDIPPLSMKPGDLPIARNQVSLDASNCVMVLETGNTSNPIVPDPKDGESLSDIQDVVPLENPEGRDTDPVALLSTTYWAHYQINWQDIINANVTKTRSIVGWETNGTCVIAGGGGYSYWWQSATGWQSPFWHTEAFFYSPGLGCQRVQQEISATYYNGTFCAGQNVYNYLQGVIIAGDYSGNIFGWHNNTYVTEPWWCPPLHWNDQMGYGQ